MLPTVWRGKGGGLSSHPLLEFRRQMDDLFGRFFGQALLPLAGEHDELRAWDFDVDDKESEIVVKAEVPGFEANEIDVQVNNGTLTINAEKKQKKGQEESYSRYRRSFTLPCGVKEDKATATYRNGVLELHLPKAEASKAKHIPIQAK
jgi:HSP20 family protein